MVRASRRRDAALGRLCEVVLIQVAVAVISVRGIRGEVAFYLVAWSAVIGLIGLAVTMTALIVEADRSRRIAVVIPTVAALALAGLALRAPIARAPVFTPPDPEVDSIALAVADFVRGHPGDVPVVSIVSRDQWPLAASTVLHLYKRGTPICVDHEWLHLVGWQFAAPPGPHGRLLFGDNTFAAGARQMGVVPVATGPDVSVFYEKSS